LLIIAEILHTVHDNKSYRKLFVNTTSVCSTFFLTSAILNYCCVFRLVLSAFQYSVLFAFTCDEYIKHKSWETIMNCGIHYKKNTL